jgi:hypothetical protein
MNEIYVKSNWFHKLVEYGLISIKEGCAIRLFKVCHQLQSCTEMHLQNTSTIQTHERSTTYYVNSIL